jgi:hypothetical protein
MVPPGFFEMDSGVGGNGWGNNELEYFTSRLQNAQIQNGSRHRRIKETYRQGWRHA